MCYVQNVWSACNPSLPFVLCQTFIINIKCSFTALEENMFDTASTSPYPQVFLRPRETVHIPFKFQTFRADQSVPEQVNIHTLVHQDQMINSLYWLLWILLFFFGSIISLTITLGKQYLQYKYYYITISIYIILIALIIYPIYNTDTIFTWHAVHY